MLFLRFRFTAERPAVKDLVLAHTVFSDSVATLKKKAAARECLAEIRVFSGAWHENRMRLPDWLKLLEQAPSVFEVVKVHDEAEEKLGPEEFRVRLKSLRGIEVEQQMLGDLEAGFIAERNDFQPHDEDWTRLGN